MELYRYTYSDRLAAICTEVWRGDFARGQRTVPPMPENATIPMGSFGDVDSGKSYIVADFA